MSAQELAAQFDQLMQEQYAEDGPGAVALVAKEGEILYHKAFGKAHLELDVDMAPHHIFRIGSITKQFTACAILKLAEENKLSLQDDITQYVKDYPTHGYTITIEHLLTHTSGIKSYTGMEKWTAEVRKKDFTPEEMIDYFKNEPMDFQPGEKFSYNNSAYFLLGYIIEQVSGKTYAEYLEEAFFDPLGMEDTHYGSNVDIIPNRAAGYQQVGGTYTHAEYLSMTQPYAAGSLISTVKDIHTWYEAVMKGEVISDASRQQAHQAFKLNNGKLTEYGYGWFIGNVQGTPVVEHGGGINGYLTASIYIPEDQVFVAVFSNCNCNPPADIAFQMAGLAIGKPYAWKKIDLSDAELKAYEGVYVAEDEEQGERSILFDSGKLYSMRSGGSKNEIIPFEKDKFFFEDALATLTFDRDEEGEIMQVVLHSHFSPISWQKTEKELPTFEELTLPASHLEQYIGKYQLAPTFIIHIFKEEQQLYAQATGQDKFEIFPYEADKFFTKVVDARMIFNRDEEGNINSMTLLQNGEHQAEKIE